MPGKKKFTKEDLELLRFAAEMRNKKEKPDDSSTKTFSVTGEPGPAGPSIESGYIKKGTLVLVRDDGKEIKIPGNFRGEKGDGAQLTKDVIDGVVKRIRALIPNPRPGMPGRDAKTPVKGKDYFTQKEIDTLKRDLRMSLAMDVENFSTSTLAQKVADFVSKEKLDEVYKELEKKISSQAYPVHRSSAFTVKKGGTTVGSSSNINFKEGSNVTITASKNGNDVDVEIASSGGGGGVSDGDKGDITVSGSGATWTIDDGVVTEAKLNTSVNASLDLADSSIQPSDNVSSLTNDAGYLASVDIADINATGTPSSSNFLRGDGQWTSPSGSGDVVGPASAVNNNIVLFDGTTGKLIKDSGVATSSFASASHTHTASEITDFDTEVSNNTDVSANTSARHSAVTVTDSAEIDFTLTGQNITASIIAGSIDETKLDTSVNASLDLADSALQNLVEDTTPQLGSNLDAQNHSISNLSDVETDTVTADSSAGLILRNSGGTAVATLGAGVGTGTTFAGGVNTGALSVTGNITVSGTVDGRDIATDGSKLDGTEAGADVTDEANVKSALNGATITSATVSSTDKVLVQDADDSDNLKTVTAQSIADLAASGGSDTMLDAEPNGTWFAFQMQPPQTSSTTINTNGTNGWQTINAGNLTILGAYVRIQDNGGNAATLTNLITTANEYKIKFFLKATNTSGFICFGIGDGIINPGTNDDGVYFEFEDTTAYRTSTSNNSFTTNTTLSAVTYTDFKEYVIHYRPGTDARFYIDGTLVATHTTHLPTLTTPTIALYNGSTATGLDFFPVYVGLKIG